MVSFFWPEAAGIRGQAFVDDDQFVVVNPEFEFRICGYNPVSTGVIPCLPVYVQVAWRAFSAREFPQIFAISAKVIFSSWLPSSALSMG